MELYLILEDIDLGYHCYGVFDDYHLAKISLDDLLESKASMRYFNQERPENWEKHFQLYIEKFNLNDMSIIEKEISWRTNYVEKILKSTNPQ
jgi:hypothetical protein